MEEFPFVQVWPQPLSASTDGYITLGSSYISTTSVTSDTFTIPASASGVNKQPFIRGQVSIEVRNLSGTTGQYANFTIVPEVQGFSETSTLIGTVSSVVNLYDDDDEGNLWRRVRISGNHLRKIASGAGFLTTSSTKVSSGFDIEHAYYDESNNWTEFLLQDDSSSITTSTTLYYQLLVSTSSSVYSTAGPLTYGHVDGMSYNRTRKISVPFFVTLPQTSDSRKVRIRIARGLYVGSSSAYAQILSVNGSLGVMK